MKLYQFPWGIYPRRIHVCLRENEISKIEMVELDVVGGENRRPQYLVLNPTGTIPTDSGLHVCQSSTILSYLEEHFPSPNMIGNTAEDRAKTQDQLALVNEAYNFAGICTFYGSPLFTQRRKPSDEVAKAMRFEYERVLESLEALAGDSDYLGGNSPNIADVAFFASEQFVRNLYKLYLPIQLSKLEAIYQRFLASTPKCGARAVSRILSAIGSAAKLLVKPRATRRRFRILQLRHRPLARVPAWQTGSPLAASLGFVSDLQYSPDLLRVSSSIKDIWIAMAAATPSALAKVVL